jgi:hypothetical protein
LSAVTPHSAILVIFIFVLYVKLILLFSIPVILIVPAKALAAIFVTPSAEIEVKEVAPLKASAPIDVTVFGNVIEVISVLS